MVDDDWSSDISRRHYLAVAAGSGMTALAGCGGGGNNGDNSGNGDGPNYKDIYADHKFTGPLTLQWQPRPTRAQYNPYNQQTAFGTGLMYDPLTQYDFVDDEFQPRIAESWEMNQDSVLLHINKDYTWSNGDPVTTEDIDLYFRLAKLMNRSLVTKSDADPQFVKDWNVKDDYTIELIRGDPGNDQIFKIVVMTLAIDTPRALWKDMVNAIESGSKSVNAAYTRRIPADKAIGNGPFIIDRTQASKGLIFEKMDKYAYADQVKVPFWNFLIVGGRVAQFQPAQALVEDGVDYYPNKEFEAAVAKKFPEYVQPIVKQGLVGDVIHFNHDRELTSDPKVRKAIAMNNNMNEVANSINRFEAPQKINGMVNRDIIDNWLGDTVSEFTDYSGHNPDRAAELMREAGYQKKGNRWEDPSGKTVNTKLPVPSNFPDAQAAGQVIWRYLQRLFGDEHARFLSAEWGLFFDDYWKKSKFDMIYFSFGLSARGMYHPHYYFAGLFSERVAKELTFRDHEYEVPATIGDPDSATETVDPVALVKEMERTDDRTRNQEIVKKLAWLHNQTAPMLYIHRGSMFNWYTRDDWKMPKVENPLDPPKEFRTHTTKGLIANGILEAKEK